MPTISVVIPTYNAEQTILETIKSVQKQTFSDFELIVIDDGSTDRTLEVLDTLKEDRLKIFSHQNGGVSVARNRGIAQSSGEFIAFIDADDLWTPDKLELQLAALRKHLEAGVAYSWTQIMDERGALHKLDPIFFEGDVYGDLLLWNFLYSGSNPLIRRQALETVGEFDPTLTHGEDWDFYIRLAAAWPFVVVTKPQIFYRQTSNSASSKIEAMEQAVLRVIERGFFVAPSELKTLKNRSLANFYQFLAHLYLKRAAGVFGAKQAEQKLQMSVRACPSILLHKKTQVLAIKLLLIRLSPKIANYIFQLVSKIRTTSVLGSN